MGDLKTNIKKELADLERLRDELRVKAHLGRADAKDAVARLEQKWPALKAELRQLEERSAHVVEDAAKNILAAAKDMREEYKRLLSG